MKHPDFVPPMPVSVSKDYDDPTSILGRKVRQRQSRAGAGDSRDDARRHADEGRSATRPMRWRVADLRARVQGARRRAGAWRAINAQELPRLNAELAKRRLPRLPIATRRAGDRMRAARR